MKTNPQYGLPRKHVKLGLIGLGEWPRQAYVPVLKDFKVSTWLRWPPSPSPRNNTGAEQFGDVVVYSDYSDLCEDPRVEAVVLAVPNPID